MFSPLMNIESPLLLLSIAVCIYLIVAILKKELKILQSLNEILQILSVSIFDKTALLNLFQNEDLQKTEPYFQEALF